MYNGIINIIYKNKISKPSQKKKVFVRIYNMTRFGTVKL